MIKWNTYRYLAGAVGAAVAAFLQIQRFAGGQVSRRGVDDGRSISARVVVAGDLDVVDVVEPQVSVAGEIARVLTAHREGDYIVGAQMNRAQ